MIRQGNKYMVKWLACLVMCSLLLSSNLAYGDTDNDKTCADDPRLCFDGFKDDGTVVTRDGQAEKTFSFPYVKAGFIVDVTEKDVLPHIAVEVASANLPYIGDLSIDVGVATSRTMVSLTWEFIPLVKAGPLIWAGYNVKLGTAAYGVGFSVLDF